MAEDTATFVFDAARQDEIERLLARYPERWQSSAVLPLLHLAQAQHGGWLPRAALDHVADRLSMPRIRVYEVASFYDMYNTVPVGPVQIRVCTTTPCWLRGADDIVRACVAALGCEVGQSSSDGRFFLREFECLGACANAPVVWVGDHFYEDLDVPGTTALIQALQRGEQPSAGSMIGRQASMPAGGRTMLQVSDRAAAEAAPANGVAC